MISSITYDPLNRLATAQSQATSGATCWGQSFGYDRYANLLNITVTKCSAPSLSVAVDAYTNRITTGGFSYDNSGDMTLENSTNYTWDAEQRMTGAGGLTFTYDGAGLRVKKSSGKLYWRALDGQVLAESNLSGTISDEFVLFARRKIASRNAAGTVYYWFQDHLGSTRAVTTGSRSACYRTDYLPFGSGC